MILLAFRPIRGDHVAVVRGAYFRICADGTLRASDNTVTARYADGLWLLGRRQHRMLECHEAVYLRITHGSGGRESIGPYESLTVAGGAIFANQSYLGAHAPLRDAPSVTGEIWREVAILSRN